jgi:predicted AlkP superfamily pyrophosphatase or phosphodiesterase
VALTAVVLVGTACPSETDQPPGPPSGAPTLEEMAQRLGADVMTALVRGFHAGTSTDIALIPEPGNTVVRWSGKGLGTDAADPRSTHPTPWDYHQRVPIVFYGPGLIPSGVRSERPVDVTDLAPTIGWLMGYPFDATDGDVLEEVAPPDGLLEPLPEVVVLVAYDGGGWNLLAQWPDGWPFLARLMNRGTVYTNATIGSAPAVTTAIHANMGTGAYPRTHGLSEITGRRPDGSVGDLFFEEEADPRLLASPTVADEWDAAHKNDPWVGMIGYESWHLGMMGKGAQARRGDRDVAVLWEDQPGIGEFFVNEEFYTFPDYLPSEVELGERLRSLDGTDGAIDGSWRGYDLADPKVVPATPAFVEHQGQALLDMVLREPIGDDPPTDLLFVELKPTDFGGHLWNMVAPEEEEVLRAQDEVLRDLVDALNAKVGRGRWVLGVTADHGQTPKPETTGGVRVHPDILGRSVDEYFGRKLVQQVTPSGLFLHHDVLEEAGITLEDVARFVAGFRYGDGLPADVDRPGISAEELERLVFAAALPATFLEGLTEEDVAAFGAGDYPEGDLTSPVEVPL